MKGSLQRWISVLLFLVAISFITNNVLAQINYTEAFDSTTFPPAGWTITPAAGQLWWNHQTTGGNPTCAPHSAGGMARFNSDNAPTGTNIALVLPVISYTNRAGAATSISFWIYRNQGVMGSDSIGILINTAYTITGSTRLGAVARSTTINLPNTEPTSGWYQYSFNVPASFTGPVNYIFLMGYSRNGNNIFIDDVQWTDFPVQCTGAPSAGTITSNPAIICGGSGDAQLTASGGSIGYAGITYQWQQYDSTSGSWTNTGTNTFTYSTGTITSSAYYRIYIGCDSSTLSDTSAAFLMTVSTSPLPVITTTPDSVSQCGGGAPILIIASGAVSYSWSPATGLSSTTGDSVYASPAGSTIYTVSGIDSIGCSGSAIAAVQITNIPNLNLFANNDSICSGDNANLNVFGAGMGSSYVWNPGGMTGNNVMVTPTATTTYTVTGTSVAGCSATDSITIYVLPATVAYFGYTINNYTVHFIDSSSNATSWMWFFGDGNLSLSQNPTYTYSADGWYNVQLIVDNGVCGSDTFNLLIPVGAVGIEELNSSNDMLLYPNPSSESITIEWIATERETAIEIVNALGQVITVRLITNGIGKQNKEQINVNDLIQGVYTIRLKTGSQNNVKTFVKE